MASDAKKKILDAKKEARTIGAVNLTAKPATATGNEKKDKRAERDELLKPLVRREE